MQASTLSIPIKILLVEDHEFTRTGLKYSLADKDNLSIVGEACNGEEALLLADSLKPNLILMDIGMPKMDGVTATQIIKERHPEIKIVMLTSRQFKEEIFAALSAGADAYCMKDISTERLLQVLETVQDGALWLDPAIARLVSSGLPSKESQETLANAQNQQKRQGAYGNDLTDRERDVLQRIAQGKANKDIAEELSLSIHTVKTHVRSLIQKLAVDDRTQAALKAVQEGLV
jgi:DNA-binding NarL/FixJ family response regulator